MACNQILEDLRLMLERLSKRVKSGVLNWSGCQYMRVIRVGWITSGLILGNSLNYFCLLIIAKLFTHTVCIMHTNFWDTLLVNWVFFSTKFS